MALSQDQIDRLTAEAERRGVDPRRLIAAAEADAPAAKPAKDGETARSDGRPTNERLLIGHLPFIKVVELRQIWLGLTDRIPDDEMTCGEYAAKHGGGSAPTTTPEPE